VVNSDQPGKEVLPDSDNALITYKFLLPATPSFRTSLIQKND
jgi:hypothetical protein